MALLERAALDGQTRLKVMAEMANAAAVNEVLMVSTCNRTEIYADVEKFHPGVAAITEILSWHTGVSLAELTEHAYVHYEERAVQHLFSVTCGLDSMVVGEGQILGQVRNAIKDAQHSGTIGRVLNDLGQRALRVGKRAHTETHLDHAGADMVGLGLVVAGRHFGPFGSTRIAPDTGSGAATASDAIARCPVGGGETLAEPTADVAASVPQPQVLTGARVLVLGAGSMSALAANTVARQGASTVIVANRTFERAARLAECLTEAYEPIRSRAVPFEDAAEVLPHVDLVISCTGAQGLVLTAADVTGALGETTDCAPLVGLSSSLGSGADAVRPSADGIDDSARSSVRPSPPLVGLSSSLGSGADAVRPSADGIDDSARSSVRPSPPLVGLSSSLGSGADAVRPSADGIDDSARSSVRPSGRPLVFLDLALPRDIDEAVRGIPGVRLVDIEDLRRAAAEGADDVSGRSGAISVVRDIVAEEVAEYQAVRRAELVAPTVVALRSKARQVVDSELSRLEGRLPHLDDRTRGEVTHALRRVADKLLHQPTVRVKELAAGPDGDSYEAALRELFGLDTAASEAAGHDALSTAPHTAGETKQS
ncbi:glutamyl-tRNA reductase [Nocardiopsis mwathae]|uniref:Glutamyl-tRNA reductase n=1 Tax=Nocardiopsis mwathae TaxID=1472723 RepID=A0A7X0D8E0_9ACTN|nr:glutamyl-tRNA reductase [Nocardiopsis mwathae]